MRAMLLKSVAPLDEVDNPLILDEVPRPEPGCGEVQIEISTCGVCHTELDEIEGRTPPPELPEKIQLLIVRSAKLLLYIPPPPATVVVFLEMMQLLTFSEPPSLETPAPRIAALLFIVQVLSVMVPES